MFKLLHYARVHMTCQELMFLICKENNGFLLLLNQYIARMSALQHNCWEIICTTYTSLTSANIFPCVCLLNSTCTNSSEDSSTLFVSQIRSKHTFGIAAADNPFWRIPQKGQLCLLRYLRCLFYLNQV